MAETVRVLVEEEEVDKRIRDLGEQISKDYEGKEVHLICVLKGGVFFMCELAKRITVPVSMDFMSVSSYGDGTASSGVVKIAKDLDEILFIRRHKILALVVYTAAVMTVLTMTFSESNDERWLNLNLLDIINRMSD